MKTKKQGISLIVLVITILVLGILAAVIIVNLSNTNTIQNAQNSVDKFSISQLAQAIELEEASYFIENGGEQPTTFEVIDRIADKGIITVEQKEEILQNNGKLQLGTEIYEIDTDELIRTSSVTCTSEEAGYRFRFETNIEKPQEGVEYTEFGYLAIAAAKYTIAEGTLEENFTFEGAEKYGVSYITLGSNSPDFKYVVNPANSDKYVYAFAIVGISEEQMDYNVYYRGYVKYVKDGIEGIMYSDVVDCNCNDVLM